MLIVEYLENIVKYDQRRNYPNPIIQKKLHLFCIFYSLIS